MDMLCLPVFLVLCLLHSNWGLCLCIVLLLVLLDLFLFCLIGVLLRCAPFVLLLMVGPLDELDLAHFCVLLVLRPCSVRNIWLNALLN